MNECQGFTLDSVHSGSIGISGCHIININGENSTIPIFGGQSVVEQEVADGEHPISMRTKKKNLQFSLIFSLLDESFTPETETNLGEFFAKSKPVEFIIDDDPERMLYVIPMIDSVEIVKFHNSTGYFKAAFQATTPYWLTVRGKYTADLSIYEDDMTFTMFNPTNIQNIQGNYSFRPEIQFTMRHSESKFDFVITDGSSTEKIIMFKNCVPDEVISMKGKYIVSSTGRNIFKDWNKQEFVLEKGLNCFSVNCPCEVYSDPQYAVWR